MFGRTVDRVASLRVLLNRDISAGVARLDRLGDQAKELAQIGAAIDRRFSHALLASVVCKPEAELALSLNRADRPFGTNLSLRLARFWQL